ncbi:DUF3347 domain-containing protein [Daejeonella sp.]|uniref:DUF3347 domain-containing protein n=1 Tax=Daejeonella sp. TaxID=2805397 RepID=UPI0030C4671E
MKKILSIVALLAAALTQTGFAQNTKVQTSPVLSLYYNITNALVSGNALLAAAKAEELKKSLSGAPDNAPPVAIRVLLTKEATRIAGTKDIKVQRAAFADLSTLMISTAKTEKLSSEPVYRVYCPMKKSYWLSSEKVVKNPYYGSSMLSCGKVEATL